LVVNQSLVRALISLLGLILIGLPLGMAVYIFLIYPNTLGVRASPNVTLLYVILGCMVFFMLYFTMWYSLNTLMRVNLDIGRAVEFDEYEEGALSEIKEYREALVKRRKG
jgi:hypothetical protein